MKDGRLVEAGRCGVLELGHCTGLGHAALAGRIGAEVGESLGSATGALPLPEQALIRNAAETSMVKLRQADCTDECAMVTAGESSRPRVKGADGQRES